MKKKTKKNAQAKNQYGEYHFSKKELLVGIAQSVMIGGSIIYLFYGRYPFWVLLVPVAVVYLRWKKQRCIQERKKKLNYQFRDALTSLSVAVQAGYSAENAVSACVRDLERLYGEETDILKEFRYIESQQKVSVPVEELFLDLGDRSGVEDIENFALVFHTAKRTGGDMNRVIQKTARMLGDKIDVRREIEATLAAKKSEQMIMSVMPAGIIFYLKLTSPGFLDVLYGNPFGFCAMSLCLGIYGTACWLGRKIVDIEV